MLALVAAAVLVLHLPLRPLEHPAEPVELPRAEAPTVLAAAQVFGVPPSSPRLRMAMAQIRLEGLALPGRNLGGLERVPGKPWVQVDRLTQLRAFDSYHEAAVAYWSLLGRLCKGALAAFDYGSPEEVAARLYRCWWFRSSEAQYARILRALLRE